MTAALARLRLHFINWRQWELNPIVIKELRQAVRSWSVTVMLLLFLGVLFITSILMLVNQSIQVEMNRQLGAQVFQIFLVILAAASMLFIPLYVGVRLAAERVESNTDLLYISTLTPGQIIRGKLFCGMYMALLFFSACMPFMAFTNLLRGVDLPTVFCILFILFCIVCVMIQVAIFFACLPISRPFKVLVGLFGGLWAAVVIVPVINLSLSLMYGGIGTAFGTGYFWRTLSTAGAMILIFTGLLHILSIGLISPPSANRALPVRLYLTVVWLLGGLICFGWMCKTGVSEVIFPWAITTMIMMVFSVLVIISNQDQLSLRVRRKIPAASGRRALAFLFYNGAAGGLLWVALIWGATLGVISGLLALGDTWSPKASRSMDSEELQFVPWLFTIMLYVFAYGLTALLIHRRFLPRRQPRIAGLLAILLTAGMAVVPSLFLFFLNQLSWRSIERLQLGSIFNVSMRDPGNRNQHLIFAGVWAVLAVLLSARWFAAQWKNFRPLDGTSVEEPTAPPVIP